MVLFINGVQESMHVKGTNQTKNLYLKGIKNYHYFERLLKLQPPDSNRIEKELNYIFLRKIDVYIHDTCKRGFFHDTIQYLINSIECVVFP